MRYDTPAPPAELGELDGLAYSLWLPDADPWAGVVVLHGARSCKESHHDFARAARSAGLSAVCFDQRGHGASGGELDGRALADVATVACLLGDVPLALRGSSLGGYLAIVAAAPLDAKAVIGVCPASAHGLTRALRRGELEFPADVPSLETLLAEHPLDTAVEELQVPLLLMHAEGDESVPANHSRELARRARDPRSELVVVPGGHHRSVQHDAELQGHSLRWLRGVISGAG
ncbi:MAG: alpha/beta fold hydrolase [Solirubrobacteraceae bacterium]